MSDNYACCTDNYVCCSDSDSAELCAFCDNSNAKKIVVDPTSSRKISFTEREWNKSMWGGEEGAGTGRDTGQDLFAALPAVVLGGALFTAEQVVTQVW